MHTLQVPVRQQVLFSSKGKTALQSKTFPWRHFESAHGGCWQDVSSVNIGIEPTTLALTFRTCQPVCMHLCECVWRVRGVLHQHIQLNRSVGNFETGGFMAGMLPGFIIAGFLGFVWPLYPSWRPGAGVWPWAGPWANLFIFGFSFSAFSEFFQIFDSKVDNKTP